MGYLVLLAGAWHLAAYCLTAVLLLPWAKGAGHAPSPSPGEWAAAYLRHDLLLLLLAGIGGAGVLLARQRLAALSWLAGCLLVLGGFRGWRAYSHWRKEAENTALLLPLPAVFAPSLAYAKLLSNSRLMAAAARQPVNAQQAGSAVGYGGGAARFSG